MTDMTPGTIAGTTARDTVAGAARLVIGWREWLALPDLGLPAIKAKIDTGAKTSALFARDIEAMQRNGSTLASFVVGPLRRRPEVLVRCEAQVVDRRRIKDSGGHEEERYVILTTIEAGGRRWSAELSLSNRSGMMFPMLLGRDAIIDAGYMVDCRLSYSLGRKNYRVYTQAPG